jgi:hypothetical protein
MKGTLRTAVKTAITTAIALGALAAPASAGILTESATNCRDTALSQPFRPWGDLASYRLVPYGGFENPPAGWQLSGGARVVEGNETFKVRGAGDHRSLLLPAGSQAVSPTVCVGLVEPTLRFFARRNSGLLSTLLVEVQVETSLGLTAWAPVLPGDVGGSQWHPTLPHPLLVNLLPLLPNDRTPVRFRFTPLLLGSWQIDDVYVDPFRMR